MQMANRTSCFYSYGALGGDYVIKADEFFSVSVLPVDSENFGARCRRWGLWLTNDSLLFEIIFEKLGNDGGYIAFHNSRVRRSTDPQELEVFWRSDSFKSATVRITSRRSGRAMCQVHVDQKLFFSRSTPFVPEYLSFGAESVFADQSEVDEEHAFYTEKYETDSGFSPVAQGNFRVVEQHGNFFRRDATEASASRSEAVGAKTNETQAKEKRVVEILPPLRSLPGSFRLPLDVENAGVTNTENGARAEHTTFSLGNSCLLTLFLLVALLFIVVILIVSKSR